MTAVEQINAEPTKSFFVDMLTKDIPLEQAILDLVDNSVDAANRVPDADGALSAYTIDLILGGTHFSIKDNCGGFDRSTAISYAFRFGRPSTAKRSPHSIGQFGVGMKRALFKFGRHFTVTSSTPAETWSIDVDVDEWEKDEDSWTFPWSAVPDDAGVSPNQPGTAIVVSKLLPEVAVKFTSANFIDSLIDNIKSKHREFISRGLTITVNGRHIDASSIFIALSDEIIPGESHLSFGEGSSKVNVRIVVGVGTSNPREAGWYVICNGRVVLEADRRAKTGWGLVEEKSNRILIPNFHNQFSRFRGVVTFDSEDSSRVPWNTTKTDVDEDSAVWRQAFESMQVMMRPVIDFLNELDADIDEYTREGSPLLKLVNKAPVAPVRASTARGESASFKAPARGEVVTGPRMVKIQYLRALSDVEFLQDEFNLSSAKAVGEKSFDLLLSERKR